MDSLTAIIKSFVSNFFTMFLFYTPWNYQNNFWFSDLFRDYETKILGRNRLSFLTHFSPVFFFYTPCKRHKILGFIVSPVGSIKSGTLGREGWNYKLFKLIFTKFKNFFFKKQLSVTASRFLNGLQGNSFYIGYPVFLSR